MKTLQKPHYKIIFNYLQGLFPNAETELNYETPFQLLVAVILSAQTTDKQVNKVTATLFTKIKKPEDILSLGLEKFEQAIRSIGLYKSKAKHIVQTSKLLAEKGGKIPNTEKELIQLPWVGEKTAKVILHVLYKQPVIAVDTHVHRVCNRLGIVKTNTPLQTSKLLENKIPKEYKAIAHHCIILFGRYYCTARNPKCSECKLQKICPFFISQKKSTCEK